MIRKFIANSEFVTINGQKMSIQQAVLALKAIESMSERARSLSLHDARVLEELGHFKVIDGQWEVAFIGTHAEHEARIDARVTPPWATVSTWWRGVTGVGGVVHAAGTPA
jgi:hypothetical protein